MPVIFAAHGAPILLDDAEWMAELADCAAGPASPRVSFLITGFWQDGAFTGRSVQLECREAVPGPPAD